MPILQPDYRIFEMNKRLQQRTEESDNLWWDAFATEFFEEEAQLTLTFCLEDGPKRYCKLPRGRILGRFPVQILD
jgi:LIM domain-binding protein 1